MRVSDNAGKRALDPELDGETEEFKALERQIEHDRTTSLLEPDGKKRRRRSKRMLDADAALAEAERRQALLHSTPLLTKMPEHDRFAPHRERRRIGLVLPAAILGWDANLRHLSDWRKAILTQAVERNPAPIAPLLAMVSDSVGDQR